MALADANTDFISNMTSDYQVLSNYVNGQFTKSMGLFSTLGWNTPPTVFDILGGTKVEVGIGVGADFINISGLGNVPLQALVASSNVNIPSQIPAPFPVVTGRVGLVNGLDFGLRFTYLPTVNVPEAGFSGQYNGMGLDLRYRIIEAPNLPTVTVGVSWDTISGSFGLNTNVTQSASYLDGGSTYNDTLAGSTNYALNWNVKSFGAKILVGKDFGVAYPFAGIGFQRNSGTITSKVTGTVLETVTDSSNTVIGTPTNVTVNVNTAGVPTILEPKAVFGIDFGQGLHWAVVGETNGTDLAVSTSFRVQI